MVSAISQYFPSFLFFFFLVQLRQETELLKERQEKEKGEKKERFQKLFQEEAEKRELELVSGSFDSLPTIHHASFPFFLFLLTFCSKHSSNARGPLHPGSSRQRLVRPSCICQQSTHPKLRSSLRRAGRKRWLSAPPL